MSAVLAIEDAADLLKDPVIDALHSVHIDARLSGFRAIKLELSARTVESPSQKLTTVIYHFH